ncbi:TetR/AcrR family transcriptional regulator [Pseudovibrio sp. Tun.PSC04-5.I4]|uniref:TetR/AcrR family transcriptional regulator n=1 Tax=Pseudovibrio sp. Tun.PSC04-5.I4 TaxID=1798213 RepID=UPI0008889B49|nr:TetR/AcrR family transcriptional regulator [Pseudovibrio sp. Tun.PSC04-5.I4]SDQ32472.1 DNA-binding transcriptional regulator, AcrR family [Pseudovibrio sp. Tun.PSC04-5.I4]
MHDKRAIHSRKTLVEAGLAELPANPMASLTEIAEVAGVSRATLYRHFDSRETLIEEILRVCLDQVFEKLAPLHSKKLRGKEFLVQTFELLLPLADRLKFLTMFWQYGEKILKEDPRCIMMGQEKERAIEEAKNDGDIRVELPTIWVANSYGALIYSAWEMVSAGQLSIEDVTKYVVTTFFDGVGVG